RCDSNLSSSHCEQRGKDRLVASRAALAIGMSRPPKALRFFFGPLFVSTIILCGAADSGIRAEQSREPPPVEPRRSASTPRQTPTPGAPQNHSEAPQDRRRSTPAPSAENQDTEYELKTHITLGDGRTLNGTIRFKAPSVLTIRHERQGVA